MLVLLNEGESFDYLPRRCRIQRASYRLVGVSMLKRS
jgi:hypothetical protein